jgi:hypothetical protein
MQPHNKAERKFLLDIDDKDSIDVVKTILEIAKIEILDFIETPNGYHIVTFPFDRRILPKCVDVKPDALKFKEMYIVKGENSELKPLFNRMNEKDIGNKKMKE